MRRVSLLVAIALVIAACGADEPVERAAAPEPLVADTVDGGQVDFNDLEGTDTLLWFWAPW